MMMKYYEGHAGKKCWVGECGDRDMKWKIAGHCRGDKLYTELEFVQERSLCGRGRRWNISELFWPYFL